MKWCQSTYDGPDDQHAPKLGARCARVAGHDGEHMFVRREPLPEPELEPVPPYKTEHKPRIGYRHGMPATVECSCGLRFTGDTDTEYAWHLIEVQADIATNMRHLRALRESTR